MGFIPNRSGPRGLSVLSGSGAPSNDLGVDGEFYIDTSTSTIYGAKSGGIWPSGVDLTGPIGPTGGAGPSPWKPAPYPNFAPTTAYSAAAPADVITHDGELWTPVVSFTSGASFNPSDWSKIAQKGADGAGTSLNNFSATSAPSTGDDTADGYSVGSIWYWPATGRLWICRSATASAAQWQRMQSGRFFGYVAGRVYDVDSCVAAAALVANSIRLVPFVVEERVTLTGLEGRVSTIGSGNIQVAIYAADPTTKLPTGNALASSSSVSTNTLGVCHLPFSSSLQLEPGLYWMASNADNTTAQMPQWNTGHNNNLSRLIGVADSSFYSAGSTTGQIGYSIAQTFGTWPDLTGAGIALTAASVPHFGIEISSSP